MEVVAQQRHHGSFIELRGRIEEEVSYKPEAWTFPSGLTRSRVRVRVRLTRV